MVRQLPASIKFEAQNLTQGLARIKQRKKKQFATLYFPALPRWAKLCRA
jgi:hypothetical protein